MATKHCPVIFLIFFFLIFGDYNNELLGLQHKGWLQVYGSKGLAVPGLPDGCLLQLGLVFQPISAHHSSLLSCVSNFSIENWACVCVWGLWGGGCTLESCHCVSWHMVMCYQTWKALLSPPVWTYLMSHRSQSHDIFLPRQCAGIHSPALVRLTYATVLGLTNRQKTYL